MLYKKRPMNENIERMFYEEIEFRLAYDSICRSATKDTFSGICCSGWSQPSSFMLVRVSLERLSDNVNFTDMY